MTADPVARLARADPRAREYIALRWTECWPTLGSFETYSPELWSDAICRWAESEVDRIEALLVRVDACLASEKAAA